MRRKNVSLITGAIGAGMILAAFGLEDFFLSGVLILAGLVMGWLSKEFDTMENKKDFQ